MHAADLPLWEGLLADLYGGTDGARVAWRVSGIDAPARTVHARMTFVAGRKYCCLEPSPDVAPPRERCAEDGIALPERPLRIELRGVVEEGAVDGESGWCWRESLVEPRAGAIGDRP